MLTRIEIVRALRWANWDAAFFTVYLALTGGAFQTGFARWLGATDLWLGVMTALPALTGVLQVVAAYWGEQAPSRRAFVLRFALLARLPWLIIAFLPFIGTHLACLPLFIGLLTLSALASSLATPTFLAWLSDLVPPDQRGRYFGRRNMILGLVAALAALPPALFLDQAVKHHRFPVSVAFSILFGIGAIFMFLSWKAVALLPEVPRERPSGGGWHEFIRFYQEPFRDRTFRQMLLFFMFWTAGQTFPGQFFTVYMLEVLKLPYTWIQGLGVLAAVFNSIGMPFWGYLSDKFGNKPLLLISGSGVVTFPLLWILATPEQMTWSLGVLSFIQVVAGFMWAGVGLAQFNLILGVAPEEQRSLYMGAISAIGSLVGGVAPLLSGVMMQALQPVLPVETRFHLFFCTISLIRAFGLLWLRGIREPGGWSATYVLAQLRASVQPRGWLALRHLARSTDTESRVQAARTLAETPTPLAVEELVDALQDPSPAVRRHAVVALGEIRDERAVEPLLQVLRDPASDLVREAIEALGKTAQPETIPELIPFLEDPRVTVRIATLRALQAIGSPLALPALVNRLPSAETPDEQVAILRAMTELLPKAEPNRIQEQSPAPLLISILDSERPEVRAEAAEALACLPREPSLAPPLRSRLQQEPHASALAALAYALATHGAEEDVPLLVPLLARCGSPLARRRIALAIGRLWQIQERLYLLLTTDELRRDRQLERLLEPLIREQPGITDALRAYAYGDYGAALQILAQSLPENERLNALRQAPSLLESWLIAVSAVA